MNLPNLKKFNLSKVKSRNYLKIGIIMTIVWIMCLIISLPLFKKIVNKAIRSQLSIRPGSMTRRTFMSLPFPVEQKIYIFHIENPENVQNGEKPKLKEIGPYVFHTHITKDLINEDDEQDTITYYLRRRYIFKPEFSNGLTGEENITVFHPVLVVIGLLGKYEYFDIITTISKGIDNIFKNPTTPFWSGKAMDLIMNGIPITCPTTGTGVTLICSEMKSENFRQIQQIDKEGRKFLFSLFGAENGKQFFKYKVIRGSRKIQDTGRVVEVNDKPNLDVWLDGAEGNEYHGTDGHHSLTYRKYQANRRITLGYYVPPYRTTNDSVWIYAPEVCMSFGPTYERKLKFHGFPARKFQQTLDDYALDGRAYGYCRKDGTCSPKGTVDLFPCWNLPIIASMPHFLGADSSFLENVQSGLQPVKEAHEITAVIDLETGYPMYTDKRMQINFNLSKIPEIKVMDSLQEMVFPFIWVSEHLQLPNFLINCILYGVIYVKRFMILLRFLCYTAFPIAAISSVALHFLIKYGKIQLDDNVNGEKKSIPNNVEIEVETSAEVER